MFVYSQNSFGRKDVHGIGNGSCFWSQGLQIKTEKKMYRSFSVFLKSFIYIIYFWAPKQCSGTGEPFLMILSHLDSSMQGSRMERCLGPVGPGMTRVTPAVLKGHPGSHLVVTRWETSGARVRPQAIVNAKHAILTPSYLLSLFLKNKLYSVNNSWRACMMNQQQNP